MTTEVTNTDGKPVEVVSLQWLLKYALGALAAIFLGGLVLSWNVSAQVNDVKNIQADSQEDAERITQELRALTSEVRELRRVQDSVFIILRYERTR